MGKRAAKMPRSIAGWGQVFLLILAIILAGATLFLLGYYGWFMYPAFQAVAGHTISGESMGFPAFGQLGDSFGVVTAVATTGALVMLFFSYWQQKSEFQNMRRIMARQAIIDTIFNMCKLYADILEQTKAHIDNPDAFEVHGRGGLGEALKSIKRKWAGSCGKKALNLDENIEALYKIAAAEFSPYEGCFRILHNIFKYIDEREELSDDDKKDYARMARSMLSNTEMEALLVNCLTARGYKMREFAEKYALLHNMPDGGVNLSADMIKILKGKYEESAFKDGCGEG